MWHFSLSSFYNKLQHSVQYVFYVWLYSKHTSACSPVSWVHLSIGCMPQQTIVKLHQTGNVPIAGENVLRKVAFRQAILCCTKTRSIWSKQHLALTMATAIILLSCRQPAQSISRWGENALQHFSDCPPAMGSRILSVLEYGQVRLPNGEKGHQFESNSIKPKRALFKRIG